jgi:hypothetical protein
VLGGSASSSAAPEMDQDNLDATPAGFNPLGDYGSGPTQNWELGMTFTAGVTGALTAIDVVLQRVWGDALSISIYSASGTPPTSVPDTLLSTHTLTSAQVMAISTAMAVVRFDLTDPVTVTAGRRYAFVLKSSTPYPGSAAAFYADYSFDPYPRGNGLLTRTPPGVTTTGPEHLLFATYVDSGRDSTGPQVEQVFTLDLSSGNKCSVTQLEGTRGTWIELPKASECTPPASKPRSVLLGWATSSTFPVAIAQRQVSRGWGAYETYGQTGNLTGVFIPAGKSALVTGGGILYSIWSE